MRLIVIARGHTICDCIAEEDERKRAKRVMFRWSAQFMNHMAVDARTET